MTDILSIGAIGYALLTLEEIKIADILDEGFSTKDTVAKIRKLGYSNELAFLVSNLLNASKETASSVLSSTIEAIENKKIVRSLHLFFFFFEFLISNIFSSQTMTKENSRLPFLSSLNSFLRYVSTHLGSTKSQASGNLK